MTNRNGRQRLSESRKIMIAIIASVVCIAAVLGVVLATTGEVSAYSQKLKLAEQYVAEGDLEAAEIQYKELINLDPKRETAYIDLAKEVYLKQSRYKEAYEILELGQKNTGKETVFKEAIEQISKQQKESEAWKAAYAEVLRLYGGDIEHYQYQYMDIWGSRKGTALCDLNEDGVDELLFFTTEQEYTEILHIYTYQDGKARELSYTWDGNASDRYETEAEDRLKVAQVAGGADYIVYKEKGQKGFTTYSNITDETIDCTTNRYEMDASCNASRTALLGMWFLLYDVDDNGNYGPDHATYYKDHKTCSREEYFEIMDPSIANIETVIFRFYGGEESDGTQYSDHPAMWKDTKGKDISLYLEDMLDKLETAQTEEPPAENKEMSEDGKNMEALLKAYGAGDYDTAFALNEKLPDYVSGMSVSEDEAEAYDELYNNMVGKDLANEYTLHYITDIDNDGKAEYLLQVGTCEADYRLEVYQYRDGKTNKVGETGFGHSWACQYPDHNGIVIVWQHMGGESLSILSIENGKLEQTEVGGRGGNDLEVEDYLTLGCALDFYYMFD